MNHFPKSFPARSSKRHFDLQKQHITQNMLGRHLSHQERHVYVFSLVSLGHSDISQQHHTLKMLWRLKENAYFHGLVSSLPSADPLPCAKAALLFICPMLWVLMIVVDKASRV